ncbi:MAG: PEP-CTERM/exosortase system-associated acyltransferase [Alphaproteobacteria bacterium]
MIAPPPTAEALLPAAGEGIRSIYWRQFAVRSVATKEQRRMMHRLRYQVYCIENPFESPAQHPDGLEIDRFDSHSVHALLIHRPTGKTVGTVRIVLPLADRLGSSFALQSICTAPELSHLPLETTGEISRFCIERAFRHLLHDRCDDGVVRPDGGPILVDVRRIVPSMTLGLIQWLVSTSQACGITHWCAVMEPTLLRLLARLGIHFEPIGSLVDYHGWRQPCVIEIDRMLKQVLRERPDVWAVIGQRALLLDHA